MSAKHIYVVKKPVFWVVIIVIASVAVAVALLLNNMENARKGGMGTSSGSSVQNSSTGSASSAAGSGLASSSKSSSQSASSTSGSSSSASSATQAAVSYKNTQYGFTFDLPKSWSGFTVISDTWQGYSTVTQKTTEKGPLIYIRHPLWTAKTPRQDIPVMVFTIDQWNTLQSDKFHIGAAPIGPTEYGRNSKYVFALPARYNYAFMTGWEEVDKIVNSHPLHPLHPLIQAD